MPMMFRFVLLLILTLQLSMGCATAEATGSSCGAGAAAGAVQALYAGTQDGTADNENISLQERRIQDALNTEIAGLLGGLAAIIAGGDLEDFYTGQSIAQSGFQNNYLTHQQEEEYKEKKKELEEELEALLTNGEGDTCRTGDVAGCSAYAQKQSEIRRLRTSLSDLDTEYQDLSRRQTEALVGICASGHEGLCRLGTRELDAFIGRNTGSRDRNLGDTLAYVWTEGLHPVQDTYTTRSDIFADLAATSGEANLDLIAFAHLSEALAATDAGGSFTQLGANAQQSIIRHVTAVNGIYDAATDSANLSLALGAGAGCGSVTGGTATAACYTAAAGSLALLADTMAANLREAATGELTNPVSVDLLISNGVSEKAAQQIVVALELGLGLGAGAIGAGGSIKSILKSGGATDDLIANLSDETIELLGRRSLGLQDQATDALGATRGVSRTDISHLPELRQKYIKEVWGIRRSGCINENCG